MVRFTFFLLCVSDALTKIATSEKVSRTSQRVVESLAVGHQHHQRNVVGHVDAAQHLDAVGQLRDDVGPHEAGDLDPLQAGTGELVDQSDLVGGGDGFGFVLKSVARDPTSRISTVGIGKVTGGSLSWSSWSRNCGAAIAAMRLARSPDAAAAQVCDAVFGDDGVDVGARGGDDPAIECGLDRGLRRPMWRAAR